jgi:hypothetical protein
MFSPNTVAARQESFGAWYDAVVKVAQGVIPKGTIVGNLIGSTKEKTPRAVPVPTPSALPPGVSGLTSFSSGTSPMLYVGLAGLAAALIFLRMKK